MFMNLHTLPPGIHMYTAWITNDPEGAITYAEEIDFQAGATEPTADLVRIVLHSDEFKMSYGEGFRVVALADQSTGEKLFQEKT